MIQYSVIRYCTTPSNTSDNSSTKRHILKLFLICALIADIIHTFAYLHYYLTHGLSFDLSLCLTTGVFLARLIFLWLNNKDDKKKLAK